MSEQSFDHNERLAIWEAHDKICKYGKEPVALDTYRVDHIIPEKTPVPELDKLMKLFNLPADFDVLAYYNHVPSCDKCNNLKGSKAEGFTEFFIATALQAAKSKAPEIAETVNRLRTASMVSSIKARYRAGIDNGTLTREVLDELYCYGDMRLTSLTSGLASAYTPLVGPGTGAYSIGTPTVLLPPSVPLTTPARISKHRKGRNP